MTFPALASVSLAWLVVQLPVVIGTAAIALGGGILCLAAWLLGGGRTALVCVVLIAAVLRADWALDDRLSPSLAGRDIVISGSVCDFPKRDAGLVRFLLEPAPDASMPPGLPRRIYLSWFGGDVVPVPGERWQFSIRLKAPRGLRNPGTFDFEGWAFAHAIGATGYVRSSRLNHRVGGNFHDCRIAEWRGRIAGMIERALPEHPAMPYVLGLVVGATYGLRSEDWDLMRRTGTTHLLAISGLNIAMVTAPFMLLGHGVQRILPRVGLRLPAGVGLVPAIIAAALYAGLAGFGVSTVRALVMTIAAASYVFAARPLCALDLLMLAALEAALLDPVSLRSASFWLSFVAVGWLVLAIPRGESAATNVPATRRLINRIGSEGRALLVLQFVLGLGLAPILLLWFEQISLVSPLVNLLAVPVFSLWILPLCLVATVTLAWVPGVGHPLMLIAADSLQFLLDALRTLGGVPGVVWEAPPSGPFGLLLAAVGVAGLCWPRPAPGRVLALLCLLPVTIGMPADAPERMRVIALDVGQGLAVIVQTRRHVMLYDAGPSWRTDDAGASVVLPVLRKLGIRTLDLLLISHADMDHRGGARSVAERFPDARLVSTRRWNLPLEHHLDCRHGLTWNWDGVSFEVQSPLASDYRRWSENDDSCVLAVVAGDVRVVLPGDIERRRERELADRLGSIGADLVLAPHHGSGSSSSVELIGALRARHVVFSTGHMNRWRFPSPAVEARWKASGACTLNTAETGAVTFEVRDDRLVLIGAERRDSIHAWTVPAEPSDGCDPRRLPR